MKNFTSLALVTLSTNLLVGCVTGDNLAPPEEPVEFPASCAERAIGEEAPADDTYTLFVGGDETKPWRAYCADMDSTPREYLTVPNDNWSLYRAGGQSPGTDVRTEFDKVRIDPITLKLDISDQTFAVSTGSLAHLGGTTVTSMPLGVAMSCGGGGSNAQVSVAGTPFLLDDKYTVAGAAGAAGHAGLWHTNQTIEMWADGDCGWIAPELAPAHPMNDAGDFLIALTYQAQP